MACSKLFGVVLGLILAPSVVCGVTVVTTTTDLAAIVSAVGMDRVVVTSLTDGRDDPHQVEARPSMVQRVRNADLVVVVGMELDSWSDSVLRASNNPRLVKGRPGYLDASIPIKKIPARVNPAAPTVGDVHQAGNPHYWLDPQNAVLVADSVRDRLVQIDPANKAAYDTGYTQFSRRVSEKLAGWRASLRSDREIPIASFHSSWDYFFGAMALRNGGTIEVYPGMGSLGVNLLQLKAKTETGKLKIVIYEPAQAKANADLFKHLGALPIELVSLTPSVLNPKVPDAYIQWMDDNGSRLRGALQKVKS